MESAPDEENPGHACGLEMSRLNSLRSIMQSSPVKTLDLVPYGELPDSIRALNTSKYC